jgi:hypothetical protein
VLERVGDCRGVAVDDDDPRGVDEEPVRAAGAERGADGLGDRATGGDVRPLGVAAARSCAVLGENEQGLSTGTESCVGGPRRT